MSQHPKSLQLLLVGDLILDQPHPDSFFDLVRSRLTQADLVAGHVEVPHTRRGEELDFDVPAPASDPDHVAALARAGFHVATLAGNHIFDRGAEGVEDTLAALHAAGLSTCGAGSDLDAAREPAVLHVHGLRVGFLSYNCVGPRQSWAGIGKAGCAFVALPESGASADPQALQGMCEDIAQLRRRAELVVVALHKGLVHTPAALASYERPLARAAIDAGADVVVGHHAHILRGVELYRGRPIYHGLGNFVTVTRALDIDNAHPLRRQWALKRRELFGFTPDPNYPNYPFHPEAKNAMIAACWLDRDGSLTAGFLPCFIRPSGQPEILPRQAGGQAVADYVAAIGRAAGLDARFEWDGERVVFS
jgi:poly-gamma-glutamate capsule biosynthesis protein CapA/YwtB (metallophosphatase superfamily)